MQIDSSTMIPWKSTDYNENLLVDFLNQGCYWKGPYSYGPKEEFFVAYAEFCNQRGTTSDSRGMTETRLQRLGHEVSRDGIRGVFVRTGAMAPVPAASDSPKLAGGNAALSMPHEIAILPGDDAKAVAEKLAYNARFHPQPKPEVIFISAKPAM
jgi:hypothetical protein